MLAVQLRYRRGLTLQPDPRLTPNKSCGGSRPAAGRRDCVCPEPKPGAPRWSTMDLTLCWAPHACVCCVCVPLAMVFRKKMRRGGSVAGSRVLFHVLEYYNVLSRCATVRLTSQALNAAWATPAPNTSTTYPHRTRNRYAYPPVPTPTSQIRKVFFL